LFLEPFVKETEPAVDRLECRWYSGQFAYVRLRPALLRATLPSCFRGYLGIAIKEQAIQQHIQTHPLPFLSASTTSPEEFSARL